MQAAQKIELHAGPHLLREVTGVIRDILPKELCYVSEGTHVMTIPVSTVLVDRGTKVISNKSKYSIIGTATPKPKSLVLKAYLKIHG